MTQDIGSKTQDFGLWTLVKAEAKTLDSASSAE